MKNTKNRLLAFLLSASMVFAASCSENSSDESETTSEKSTTTTTTTAQTSSGETSSTTSEAPEEPDDGKDTSSGITPALWKIETDGGAVVYFMGSMHALPEEAYPFPQEITDAYNSSDFIAVECDTVAFAQDIRAQFALSKKMIYTDGTTIKGHISADPYDALVNQMTDWGIYNTTYDMMKPAVWQSFIEDYLMGSSGILAEKGFDEYFLNKAKEDGKGIIEVESVESQMNMLFGFSDEINSLLLETYVDYTQEMYGEELRTLYETWAGGNLADIEELLGTEYDESLMTEEEIAIMKDYNKQMMDDRNIVMADKLIELSKGDENVFYYVGLAHYVGETGILKLLDNAGVKYEKIQYN